MSQKKRMKVTDVAADDDDDTDCDDCSGTLATKTHFMVSSHTQPTPTSRVSQNT